MSKTSRFVLATFLCLTVTAEVLRIWDPTNTSKINLPEGVEMNVK